MKNPHLQSIAAAMLPFLAVLQSACSTSLEKRPHTSVALAGGTAAAPLCRATSTPFVASGKPSRPYPLDGAIAFADEDRVKIVFHSQGPTGRPCVAVDLDTLRQTVATSPPERDACDRLGKPRSPVMVMSDAETMLAWDATRGDRTDLFLGVVVYDLPAPGGPSRAHARVVAHPFAPPPGGLEGSPSEPGLADIGAERFLLSWTQGNDEKAQLRAQPVAAWEEAVGPAMDVSPPESSVIGSSSAAFSRDGSGFVAYFASAGDAIELMATQVSALARP
jgi:hypothetical protein